jgi:hypothetical protein
MCTTEHMRKPNPALFDPLKRMEDASRRAGGVILTAPEAPLQDNPRIALEIREMEQALADFKSAVARGETVGEVARGLIKE